MSQPDEHPTRHEGARNDAPRIPDDLPAATDEEALAFAQLLGLIRRLRAPDGCPWDREQTLGSMTPYLIEETYEVIDAIERGDDTDLREELGDLVFLLVFCMEIAREEGRFAPASALEHHVRKMIARHPHVFARTRQLDSGGAARQWEEIKQREKSGRRSVLDGRLPALPALTGAYRVQEKASAVGFDWQQVGEVLDKVEEEIAELRAELDRCDPGVPASPDTARVREELGDVLFALVNVARFLAVDPEAALRGTIRRFIERFRHIEARLDAVGRTPAEATLTEMDALWEEAKRRASTSGRGEAAGPGAADDTSGHGKQG
jgi:MazG family protein